MEETLPYLLSARGDTRDVWAGPKLPQLGAAPHLLADGSNVYEKLAAGDVADLGFVPQFVQSNRGRRLGDLIWTTGDMKVASAKFVTVLRGAGVTGFTTFPVEVRFRTATSEESYVGFAVTSDDPADGVYRYRATHFWKFLAGDDVVHALHEAGADRLRIEPVAAPDGG